MYLHFRHVSCLVITGEWFGYSYVKGKVDISYLAIKKRISRVSQGNNKTGIVHETLFICLKSCCVIARGIKGIG